jgi:uncharacterized membrane protein
MTKALTIRQAFQARWPMLRSLILATLVCYALVLIRCWLLHKRSRLGICHNILLAWIPCLLAIPLDALLSQKPSKRWAIVLLGALWLVFLPNAPYVVTDIMHWRKDKELPVWFDWIFISSCAWVSLFLAYEAITLLHRRIAMYGKLRGWGFVIIASTLSSLGIYLGRFLRWNSWEVATKPTSLLHDLATSNHLHQNSQLGAFMLGYTLFTLLIYGLLHSVTQQARRDTLA